MILAIDVGNSNIVIGAIHDSQVQFVSRMATEGCRTEDQYAIYFREILSLYQMNGSDFSGGIISSVVPPVTNVIAKAVEKTIGKEPLIVGPGIKTGLNITIDNPSQLGSDIVVDNVAARHLYRGAVIVIDMGTATTISATDEKGNIRGGAIAPGVGISLNALSQNAAQLQGINLENPKKVIGTNTVDSMKSGMVYGWASMLDGMIERFLEELGTPATVIATGGHAKYIIPHCKQNIVYNENLLLTGLDLVYQMNCKA
ncbi:MAG: type III pantothenate kinase [Clostridia bacterium]|nr:type III pantothenate kinase [Clostridia bacterium]